MDDSILVTLIGESLLAASPSRQRAARILLDLLRADGDLKALDARVALLDGQTETRIEIAALIERYRLDRDPD